MADHILICGDRRSGKTTLIERLLEVNHRKVFGYYTISSRRDPDGRHNIYIFDASDPSREMTEENRVGSCDMKKHEKRPEVFDRLGADFLRGAAKDGIIVMDEIGFMENEAEQFKNAVREALTGDIPVLAAVKARYDFPFLNEIRNMSGVDHYDLTQDIKIF